MLKVLILCSYYYVQSVLVNQSYFGQGHFDPPKHLYPARSYTAN